MHWGHEANERHRECNQRHIQQKILPTHQLSLATFDSCKGHQAQTQVFEAGNPQACSSLLRYCWQALPHSSRSWIKTYPCATWQPVFLLRARTIVSCTICEDFLTLFPIWSPPGVWWLDFSTGCPTLIWCWLSANPWIQGPHSDWFLWTSVLCGCRDS